MAEGTAQERFQQAVHHRMNGEYDTALELLNSVLPEQPNNPEVYHEIGLIHTLRVNIDESIAALTNACRLAPTHVPYILTLAKAHTMYGDYDKAKPIFEYILKLDPFNDEAQKNLAFMG